MLAQETILIVDDSEFHRKCLREILSEEYCVIEAENGEEALHYLERHSSTITAVILDLVMPKIDGFEFLKLFFQQKAYEGIPVVVSTGDSGEVQEAEALRLGAWDFISKPYHAEILKFRLKNAIHRSQLPAFQQLQALAEYDTLTGLHNKATFFAKAREMLDVYMDKKFLFVRFDIDRFQLVNSFFGQEEGDRLLCYLAREFRRILERYQHCVFGRMEADVFACCIEYHSRDHVRKALERIQAFVRLYNLSFDIVPTFGLYYLDDLTLPIRLMLDRATMASKTCKGNYIDIVGEYLPEMSLRITEEQEIVNEMAEALAKEQFVIFIQPKYSLANNCLSGGEALVRWMHPIKGMISPGIFIPVFEKNGFISKLDYYVWERVCRLLRTWLDDGLQPKPISVNVSRVNLYNPQIVENICALIDKYKIPAKFLELELTESAYTDNPLVMCQVVSRLRERGFSVSMDDFGTGYSSLSILKDIEVDVLKIDLHFLADSTNPGRGENIIASIIRMAKWLNIPTVAEGVEKPEQVEFLKSINCDYGQGFIFARPMPILDYEVISRESAAPELPQAPLFDWDSLWEASSLVNTIFSDATQATCLYEIDGEYVEILRANEAFQLMIQTDASAAFLTGRQSNTQEAVQLRKAIQSCIELKSAVERRCHRAGAGGREPGRRLRLQYLNRIGSKHVVLGSVLLDAVGRRDETQEDSIQASECVILICPAQKEANRLKRVLASRFHLLHVDSVRECLRILLEDKYDLVLILLGESLEKAATDELLQQLDRYYNERRIQNVQTVQLVSQYEAAEQDLLLNRGMSELIRVPCPAELLCRRIRTMLDACAYRCKIERNDINGAGLSRVVAQDGIDKAEEIL